MDGRGKKTELEVREMMIQSIVVTPAKAGVSGRAGD
jgi:hypothetical protein